MGSVFKPTYTKKDSLTGETVTHKLKKWYVKYRDAEGVVRKVAGFTDKSATQQLLAKLEREAELEKLGITDPFQKHRKRPLVEHLNEFEQNLNDGKRSADYVSLTIMRIRSLVQSCDFTFIDDISASRVETFLSNLRKDGRSIQTSNHYLKAIKQFCRWLVTDSRTRDSRIAHVKTLNVKVDRRHDRRSLSAEEFSALIESALNGPMVQGIPGPERAMLYVLAAWTGFRRNELASLTLLSTLRHRQFKSMLHTASIE